MVPSLLQIARTLGNGLLHLLYPPICWVCETRCDDLRDGICLPCIEQLTLDPMPACPRCAGTIGPHADVSNGCHRCRDEKFAFDEALRLGPYQDRLREVILRMKWANGAALAEVIGILWARQLREKLAAARLDVVTPVPLHWRKRWSRGFNQCDLLAKALSEELKVPCRLDLLRRIRNTPPQISLGQARRCDRSRRDNVRDVFRVRPESGLSGKTVLLVEDVMTSGATAHETARALRSARPARIIVAVLASAR